MAKKKKNKKTRVAYFCMEYGLDNSFKSYAGGLGILAGDYLKGAKDLNLPMVGIGLLWKQGYTDQRVDEKGKVYDCFQNYSYDFLEDTGITVSVDIFKSEVRCKVWKLDAFGNVPLYLLDTNLPDNPHSWISGQLYGWFGEERVAQEMVLGIGGVRALRALGIKTDVYHFNEGHALFAGFELLREKMDKGASFEKALAKCKEQIVFTTHTPIIQGNESHPIERLMYVGANQNLTYKQLKKLGGAPFNMTVGALRMSRISNAVAQLHGETANKMWANTKRKSKIIAITNSIHKDTWVDPAMIEAAENNRGIYATHLKNKRKLIRFIQRKNGVKLDENKLIIGFSRRSVPYKRSDLIFSNMRVVGPMLRSQRLQIVFSGKAHPNDDRGKAIVERLYAMSKKYPNAVVFLQSYDMEVGALLTRGSDVWLNNPRRPKEASGTSGMKAAMNGVLNLSTLDGWWPEACEHGVNGWQFGDAFESEDEAVVDV
ncbi:MAG: alpha-glucan family phosphorylase, partial [Bacteroidota bacterium]